MDKIIEQFNRDFAHWGIRLPLDAVREKGRGKIIKAGWAIWYRFGVGSKGEYLDYYSAHRMTDDRHTRVYEDGQIENLPTIISMYRVTDDPEENSRIRAEFYAKNQEIAAMLAEKGFGISGEEPGAIQINRFLHVRQTGEKPRVREETHGEAQVTESSPAEHVSESQSKFLKGEILFLSLQAALSTRSRDYPVYAKGVRPDDRAPFRESLMEYLDRNANQHESGRVSDKEHCCLIEELSLEMSSSSFGKLLHKDRFRIGVAQKALNLYLKYLWCLEKIPEPPHCPFDNIVIGELDNCGGIAWTEFDDTLVYEHLVHQARLKAGDLSLAEWELRIFNRH